MVYQAASQGGGDAFVAKVADGGGSLAFLSYLGGFGDDKAYGVALGLDGKPHIAGETASRSAWWHATGSACQRRRR